MTACRALLAALLVVVLAGCSSTVPGRALADPDAVLPAGVDPVSISGAAADELGRDAVHAAYAVATEMASTFSFQEPLLRLAPDEGRAEDFAAIAEYLAPELAESYLDDVDQMLAGDTDADARVTSLQLWALVGPGVELADSPAVGGYAITDAEADVSSSDSGGVELTFTESATLSVTRDGDPATSTLEKAVTLVMVASTEGPHPWLVDDYRVTLDIGDVVPA